MSLRAADAFSAAKQTPLDKEISLNRRLHACTPGNERRAAQVSGKTPY